MKNKILSFCLGEEDGTAIFCETREEFLQYIRVRGGYPLAVEILQRDVLLILRNCKRQATSTEAEFLKHVHPASPFGHFVVADDSDVRSTHFHCLRDVIVAQEEDL